MPAAHAERAGCLRPALSCGRRVLPVPREAQPPAAGWSAAGARSTMEEMDGPISPLHRHSVAPHSRSRPSCGRGGPRPPVAAGGREVTGALGSGAPLQARPSPPAPPPCPAPARVLPARHLPGLDGLRMVSVLLVVFYHFGLRGVPGGHGV